MARGVIPPAVANKRTELESFDSAAEGRARYP